MGFRSLGSRFDSWRGHINRRNQRLFLFIISPETKEQNPQPLGEDLRHVEWTCVWFPSGLQDPRHWRGFFYWIWKLLRSKTRSPWARTCDKLNGHVFDILCYLLWKLESRLLLQIDGFCCFNFIRIRSEIDDLKIIAAHGFSVIASNIKFPSTLFGSDIGHIRIST